MINLERLKKRKELLQIEIGEIDKQLSFRKDEIMKNLKTKDELMTRKEKFMIEKRNVEEKLETLHQKIEGYEKENRIFEDLDKNLKEASENL